MVCLELGLLLATSFAPAQDGPPTAPTTVALVVGAAGEPQYAEHFERWAERWRAAASDGGARVVRVDEPSAAEGSDHERLRAFLAAQPAGGAAPLWLVFLGHGTFDGERARFNLRGPDVRALEVAQWLEGVERPVAVVVCAASSGPFVNRLSRAGRTVVTATRSGSEVSFSWFGEHLSAALGDLEADLDADGQVSLLEAFRFASARTAEFYAGEARLATEHALIDDNGDGLGTQAAGFRGVRALQSPSDGALPDGVRAHRLHLGPSAAERAIPAALRAERDALEQRVEELRARKVALAEDEYYASLEPLMLELARLYAKLEDR